MATGELAYLSPGDTLTLRSDGDAGLLLFGGLPLNEPVVHHGPFVMNTRAEIERAVRDYQEGVLVQM